MVHTGNNARLFINLLHRAEALASKNKEWDKVYLASYERNNNHISKQHDISTDVYEAYKSFEKQLPIQVVTNGDDASAIFLVPTSWKKLKIGRIHRVVIIKRVLESITIEV